MKIESKTLGMVMLSLAGVAILFLTFAIGIYVGSKKAEFSFAWAEQYHRNFAGPREGFLGQASGKEFIDANGVIGQIVKISNPNDSGQIAITIRDQRDNIEKNILADSRTSVTFLKNKTDISRLKIDDEIIIIGQPSQDGQIEAKFIRVMPKKPSMRMMPGKFN